MVQQGVSRKQRGKGVHCEAVGCEAAGCIGASSLGVLLGVLYVAAVKLDSTEKQYQQGAPSRGLCNGAFAENRWAVDAFFQI